MACTQHTHCDIPIANDHNHIALVSKEDYHVINQFKWSRYEQTRNNKVRVNVVTRINSKLVHMHHMILGKPKSKHEIIIHKNNNSLDNRRTNLVFAKKQDNLLRHIENIIPIQDNAKVKTHPILRSYKADIYGEVFKCTNKKVVGCNQACGYNSLKLTAYDGTQVNISRHLFVYECFNGVKPDGYEIDHIDNNKKNNTLANLQCLTIKEHRIKTMQDYPDTGQKVAKKLSKPVIAVNLNTLEKTRYASLTEAANNIQGSTITKICSVVKGRRASHKGFTFTYEEKNEQIDNEYWVCLTNPLFRGIEVSNLGRVRGKRGIITSGRLHGDYMRISVSQNNIKKCVFVHQLVCEAFHGKSIDSKIYSVDHIDRNTTNNHESNLRWATRYEQRINTKDVKAVQVQDAGGIVIAIYDTIVATALGMEMHAKTVKRCCETGRKYKGYSFKFVA
jgi:hypothetical protein